MDRFKASLQEKMKILGPKMGSFASETFSKIKDLQKHVQPLKDQLSMQFRTSDEDIMKITPTIFWMTFPAPDKIDALSKFLNSRFSHNYYIWNVSEHEYATEWFQNQVANHVHPGYPCPSLLEIFTICKNILNWLNSDQENVAIVNCQSSKGRSILILSILLAMQSSINPAEVLLTVCQLTQVKDFQALFPSQHLYLTYAENILNGLKPNTTPIRLVSIILSQIPEVKSGGKFAPYLQIFREGKIIFNSLQTEVQKYDKEDNSVLFNIGGLKINDDILIRCKHFESNANRISLFRLMFNTCFIYGNVLRFSTLELDQSSNLTVPKDFFIDLIFERGIQKSSQQLWQKEPQETQINNNSKSINDFTQLMIKQVKDCQEIISSNKILQIDSQTLLQDNGEFNQQQIGDSEPSDNNKQIAELGGQSFTIIGDLDNSQNPIKSQIQKEEQKQPILSVVQKEFFDEDETVILDEVFQEEFNRDDSSELTTVSQGEKQELMNKILQNDQEQEIISDSDNEDVDDYISNLTKDQ